MLTLTFGILLFVSAFLIHLFWWRVRLPKNHTKALGFIFFTVWILGLFGFLYGAKFFYAEYTHFRYALSECLQLSFLYFSLVLTYITTYSAVEVDSPSIVMVREIERAGRQGLDGGAFEKNANDGLLLIPRINDLIKDKMICNEDGVLKLSPKGWIVVKIFITYRSIIRRGKGG